MRNGLPPGEVAKADQGPEGWPGRIETLGGKIKAKGGKERKDKKMKRRKCPRYAPAVKLELGFNCSRCLIDAHRLLFIIEIVNLIIKGH